jgi:hypothetical protein
MFKRIIFLPTDNPASVLISKWYHTNCYENIVLRIFTYLVNLKILSMNKILIVKKAFKEQVAITESSNLW